MRRLFILFLCIISSFSKAKTQSNSVDTETVDGIIYIIHKVTEKETLYTVSRKYDVPIYEIIASNPPTEFGLQAGQTIRIPLRALPKETVSPQDAQTTETLTVEEKEPPALTETGENADIPNENIDPEPDKSGKEVIHIVKAGDTMYALSVKYDVSIDKIRQWNGLKTNTLSIGQKLIVKKNEEDGKRIADTPGATIHLVKPSETLYSISRAYGVSVAEIKQWNGLTTHEIGIGRELVLNAPEIPAADEVNTGKENEKKPPATIAPPANDSSLTERERIIDTAKYRRIEPDSKTRTNFEEVVEFGLAEQIAGRSGGRKYLALHRTAKTGTIMKVKNEMNNQEVFVRVIGSLPDTGINKNVVIKISEAAYSRLGAIDPRFRVAVSYIP